MPLLRRLAALFALSLVVSCFGVASPAWPAAAPGRSFDDEAEEASIVRGLPVCVASQSWSAGELGQSVLFHAKREGRRLTVGYFVYWSTERPWGKNALSYSFLPALFIDAFYSHLFFMFPGAQRVLYGAGDVEGARVVYEQHDDGRWTPVSAVAEDGLHREVPLPLDEFTDQSGRVVLLSDVWSHQLGARGARSFYESQRDAMVCFEGDSLSPLTDEVADLFRLGSPSNPRRAAAAWRVEPSPSMMARAASTQEPEVAGILR